MMKRSDGKRVRLCPVETAARVAPVVEAWAFLRAHGVLPVAGGWLDQAQSFLAAVRVLDSEAASDGG